MTWKAFFYEQGSNKYIPKNYGLKSLNCPPKTYGDDKLWEWFNKCTENHQISFNKNFFPAVVNGRYKNYKEHPGNFNICR